jgi:histidyl-tRNA synthetase
VKVLIPHFGEETRGAALLALRQLREAGIAAESYPDNDKLKKQFAYANKKGVPYLLMIGPEEAAQGICQLKDMVSGVQETITLTEAIGKLAPAKG